MERGRLANHKDWILQQVKAIGEDLEQSSIEIAVESKLPVWILDKVYQQKDQEPCHYYLSNKLLANQYATILLLSSSYIVILHHRRNNVN
ncbi:putative toxin [Dirofilaria immitis]